LRHAWHIDRGYEEMVGKLGSVGAQIEAITVDPDAPGAVQFYE
jgi:UDP-N-acetylglucosamine enolpyruvyl transferase